MAVFPGYRASPAPPRVSFSNVPGDRPTTLPVFTLPAGVGELQYFAYDPNDPGILTLTDPNSVVYTLNTSVGDIPGFTGSFYFQTLGGVFKLKVTKGAKGVTIYFRESSDMK